MLDRHARNRFERIVIPVVQGTFKKVFTVDLKEMMMWPEPPVDNYRME